MGIRGVFAVNLEYLLTRPGLMKLMTLIFGLFSVGLGIHATEESVYNAETEEILKDEEYFESTVSFIFVLSFVYLALLSFSDTIATSKMNRYVDTIYHAIAGKGLIIAGFLLIFSAISIQKSAVCKTYEYFRPSSSSVDSKCQLYNYKLAAAIFSILNGLLCEVTALVAYMTKEPV